MFKVCVRQLKGFLTVDGCQGLGVIFQGMAGGCGGSDIGRSFRHLSKELISQLALPV